MSSKRYCLVGVFCPCHKSTIQRKLSYKGCTCICFIFTIALCIYILCFMILFKNDLLYINTNIHVCTAPCLTIYMCINLLYSNETILCALKKTESFVQQQKYFCIYYSLQQQEKAIVYYHLFIIKAYIILKNLLHIN